MEIKKQRECAGPPQLCPSSEAFENPVYLLFLATELQTGTCGLPWILFGTHTREKKAYVAEVCLFFNSCYNTYKIHLLQSTEATKPTLWLNLKDKRTSDTFILTVCFFSDLCTNTFYRVIYASRVVPTTAVRHAVSGFGCFTAHI